MTSIQAAVLAQRLGGIVERLRLHKPGPLRESDRKAINAAALAMMKASKLLTPSKRPYAHKKAKA